VGGCGRAVTVEGVKIGEKLIVNAIIGGENLITIDKILQDFIDYQ
jgi:hypothetical protein